VKEERVKKVQLDIPFHSSIKSEKGRKREEENTEQPKKQTGQDGRKGGVKKRKGKWGGRGAEKGG